MRGGDKVKKNVPAFETVQLRYILESANIVVASRRPDSSVSNIYLLRLSTGYVQLH